MQSYDKDFKLPNLYSEILCNNGVNGFVNFVLGHGGIVVAAGIIVRRKDRSGGWFRSNCQLVLNEAGLGSDLCSLMQAVDTSYMTHEIDLESEFYLNNAGTGGTGGTGDVTPSGGSSADRTQVKKRSGANDGSTSRLVML